MTDIVITASGVLRTRTGCRELSIIRCIQRLQSLITFLGLSCESRCKCLNGNRSPPKCGSSGSLIALTASDQHLFRKSLRLAANICQFRKFEESCLSA